MMQSQSPGVYLITGAASGIGAATAEHIARLGHAVVIADVNRAALDRGSEDLVAAGAESVLPVTLDVSSSDSWSRCIELADREFGHLDGLVNNAGVTRDATMKRMNADEWHTVVDVHLTGTWLGCKNAAPLLAAAGSAAIVNISSSGRHGVAGQTNYSAAKAGIVGLSKAVARELAPKGVRCNVVAPGGVETPLLASVPDHILQGWRDAVLLRRLAKPQEVAAAIWFLLSDASSYITAHVLDVNGGEEHL